MISKLTAVSSVPAVLIIQQTRSNIVDPKKSNAYQKFIQAKMVLMEFHFNEPKKVKTIKNIKKTLEKTNSFNYK
jgi:hypothetical protein